MSPITIHIYWEARCSAGGSSENGYFFWRAGFCDIVFSLQISLALEDVFECIFVVSLSALLELLSHGLSLSSQQSPSDQWTTILQKNHIIDPPHKWQVGPYVQATSIRALLLRSFAEAYLLVPIELTLVKEASTSTRHWAAMNMVSTFYQPAIPEKHLYHNQ